MSEDKDLSNITRIDQLPKPPKKQGQHGWWVRFRRDDKPFNHFFNDRKYGGKEKALASAMLFRDAVKTQYLNDHRTARVISGGKIPTQRSISGVLGVSRSSYTGKKGEKEYLVENWQATWPTGSGKSANRGFSVKKYGEEGAFRLALKAREEGIAQLKLNRHPSLEPINNVDQKIWRYMDFTKFVSMLEEEALFFSCISILNDPFEGTFSKINKELRPLIYKGEENPENISNTVKGLREKVAVSCWHMNEYESAAMWELYSKSEEAVCIQSTYEKLKKELEGKSELGVVNYVDYNEQFIPEYDPYLAFLYKRKSFEHERELRAVQKEVDEENFGNGQFEKIRLSNLIENIYVSPSAPNWFFELVKKTIKRYKINKPVIQSSLSDDPVY